MVFSQTGTTTITDNKVIGVAYSQTESYLYSATVGGNVAKLDATSGTLIQIGESFPSGLSGTHIHMNHGPTADNLTFKAALGGIQDINVSDSTSAGGSFGSSQAKSFSRQVTFGGDIHLIYFDQNLSEVRLYNRPGDSSSTIFTLAGSGLSDIAALDFAYTGNNLADSYLFAASSAGQIIEYSLAGYATGSSGTLADIGLSSNETISGLSYNDGHLAYSVYNSDFNLSMVSFGTFTGTVIPEPSTYAALAGLGDCLTVAFKRRRALGLAWSRRQR